MVWLVLLLTLGTDEWKVTVDRTLPVPSFDAIWLDEQRIALATLEKIVAYDPTGPWRPEPLLAPRDATPTRLAGTDPSELVATAPFAIFWGTRSSNSITPMDVVMALDSRAGRTLVVGGHRNEEETGYQLTYLWEVPFGASSVNEMSALASSGNAQTRPVPISRCSWLPAAQVRFLPDDSYVVVPGVEPGVFWYGEDGALIYAWRSEDLGLDDVCPADAPHRGPFRTAATPRYEKLNRWRYVDEILPVGDTAVLVLREVSGGEVRWSLRELNRSGRVRRGDLPLRSKALGTEFEGDFRSGRLLALLSTTWYREEPLAAPPRLVVAVGLEALLEE